MKIIENKYIPFEGFKAITLGKWIFVRKGSWFTAQDYNHECIHYEQQKELLFVPFFILYALEYVIRFILYIGNAKKAYRAISFEKEAYTCERNPYYLEKRKRYTWIKYMFN